MTDFKRIFSLILLAVGIILIGALACFISSKRAYHAGWRDAKVSIKPDTQYVEKTKYEEKPVPVIEYRDTGRIVYVQVPVKDTTGHGDTTLVPMHPEVKQYADTVDHSYELQISGICPALDWIRVYQKTAYITVPVPEYQMPKYIASLSATGFLFPNSVFMGAGVDVDYWDGKWQYELSVGYGIHASQGVNTPGYYGLIKAKYNLFGK